jgi:hypothetical protein
LENVLDRVEMADLYQIKTLYASCGQLIRLNLQMVKKSAKWLDLKKKSSELAFAILEEFAEDGNRNVNRQFQIPAKNSFKSLFASRPGK